MVPILSASSSATKRAAPDEDGVMRLVGALVAKEELVAKKPCGTTALSPVVSKTLLAETGAVVSLVAGEKGSGRYCAVFGV
jgi:hypothetical protein